ncbi:MAG: YaiI/YqxD family protein [Synergistaceae bacterium]|nr:YaiI/YqxD family protein [Synergistaceae bacterium]
MQILVDADACPVKQIIVRLARRRDIPVVMLIDDSHELDDGYSRVITVSCRADNVDFALMRLLTKEDIVVTQDFGLAAMALGKGAAVISQNGLVYTNDNIDRLLFERHLGQKIRRAGGRAKGPPKRTREDDERFEETFSSLLDLAIREHNPHASTSHRPSFLPPTRRSKPLF